MMIAPTVAMKQNYKILHNNNEKANKYLYDFIRNLNFQLSILCKLRKI